MSALEGPSLHIRGHVLLGDDRAVSELWVKDGVVTFTRPSAPGTHQRTIEGWVLPGLVDMHAHIGLGPDGAVGLPEAEEQARAHRRAGVLAVRDAGSPTDTSPLVHRPPDAVFFHGSTPFTRQPISNSLLTPLHWRRQRGRRSVIC